MAEASPTRSVNKSTYLFGALGGLLFGYDLGVVAGALLFLTPDLSASPFEQGLVVSTLLVGAMIGAISCGSLSDRVGRRIVVLLAAVLFAVGAVGAALSPNITVLLFFRFVMGLGVGTVSVLVPIYLSEIAPAENRGALSGLNQLMISTGILISYLVNLALAPYEAWRWMFGLALIPSLLLLVGTYFQPESPRWLVRKGREEEARAVLSSSRDEARLDAEIEDIKRVDRLERQQIGLRQLLRSPRLRRLLAIGIGLAVFQQIIGINTIIYYAPSILTSIGYGDYAAILVNAGLGALTVVITVVMILFVVDRLGRKRPLMFGALGMALSMAVLGIVFFSIGIEAGGTASWIAIACLAFFKISFSLSWGGIVWIMLGEIFPLRARGTAMGTATFSNWLGNFVVGLTFPVLLALGTGLVFFIFAALGILAFLFASFFVPETKGRSLEEIEDDLVLGKA
jgi:sugar porter (SP) family MFS transporter